MRKKVFAILVIMVCFPFSLLAETLTIQVLQKGSGDAVEGATVAILETAEYVNSDLKGYAEFEEINYPVTIKLLNVGYETLQQTLSDPLKIHKIYLVPLRYSAESVEVVAERIAEKVSKVTLSIDELKKSPGSQGDPIKVIQSLPGVVTATEGSGAMYVRGSDPNDNIVWFDRAEVGYAFHMDGLQSTINPHMVQDFNVFLGGFPVEYGETMGGALDIKLKKPKKDRLHQQYSIGNYQSSLFIEGPLGKANGATGFMLGARRSYVDLLLSPEQMTDVINDDESDTENEVVTVPTFTDVQAIINHQLSHGELSLKYFSASDEVAFLLNDAKHTDPEAAGELQTKMGYQSLTLDWLQQWNDSFSHVAPLTYLRQYDDFQIGTDESGQPYYVDVEFQELSWQPELTWQATEKDKLVAGGQITYMEIPADLNISRPPRFDEIDFSLTLAEKYRIDQTYKAGEVGPYSKYFRQWNDRLSTMVGLRYSRFKVSSGLDLDVWSPRASLEYQLSKKTALTAAWGLYHSYPQNMQWTEQAGNPGLSANKSEHRIIGIRQSFNSLWSAQVEAWHKPMWDLVITHDAFSPPDNYQNKGKANNYGLDVLVKRQMASGKMGWLSYSYLHANRTNNITGITKPFIGDQRHTLTLVWSQPLSGSWNKWDVGFRFRANSGKPYYRLLATDTSVPGVIQPVYADEASRLPNFYQLDIRFDREFRFNKWTSSFYLDLNNITNQQNVSGYDYGTRYERINNPREISSMGFMPFFGIEVKI